MFERKQLFDRLEENYNKKNEDDDNIETSLLIDSLTVIIVFSFLNLFIINKLFVIIVKVWSDRKRKNCNN